jgi:hypothetical protein
MSQAVFSAGPLGDYISQPTKLIPVSVRKGVSMGTSVVQAVQLRSIVYSNES